MLLELRAYSSTRDSVAADTRLLIGAESSWGSYGCHVGSIIVAFQKDENTCSMAPVFNLGDMSPPGHILTFPRGHEVGYGVQKRT